MSEKKEHKKEHKKERKERKEKKSKDSKKGKKSPKGKKGSRSSSSADEHPVKVVVVYYSLYTHAWTMAQAIAEGYAPLFPYRVFLTLFI